MDGVHLVFRASMSTKIFERPKAHDGSRASDHRAILDNWMTSTALEFYEIVICNRIIKHVIVLWQIRWNQKPRGNWRIIYVRSIQSSSTGFLFAYGFNSRFISSSIWMNSGTNSYKGGKNVTPKNACHKYGLSVFWKIDWLLVSDRKFDFLIHSSDGWMETTIE